MIIKTLFSNYQETASEKRLQKITFRFYQSNIKNYYK